MKIRRGIIDNTENGGLMQKARIEGLHGEVADAIDRFQNFGFSSFPVKSSPDGKGAEVIIADVGSGDRRVIVCTEDRRYRPTVGGEGDVMMYGVADTPGAAHGSATQRIVLLANGDIIINDGQAKITLSQGNINIIGNVNITGNVDITGTLTDNGKNVGSTHQHANSGGTGTGGTPI